MDVLSIVLPVLLLIGIGVLCRSARLLSHEGVNSIKQLVMKIMLPVAIFQALGTATYSMRTIAIVALVLGGVLLTFFAGFLLRFLFKPPYKKYLPFLVCLYEGGMVGYPLYVSLCGTDRLSNIALLDVACLLFGFGVYMSLLQQAETGERLSVKMLAKSALTSPTFIATVLGIIVGATGLLNWLIGSSFGEVYTSLQTMVTSGLSALILIVIGYEFHPTLRLIGPCFKTIACRILLQAMLAVALIFLLRTLFGENHMLDIAIIMLMASPAPFSMQSYLKTEEGGEYVSTFNSIYCIFTVAVYVVLAFFV